MRLYVELDRLQLVEAVNSLKPVARIETKRGDAADFDIVFVRNAAPVRLDGTVVITFAAKVEGEYDSDPVVLHQTFVPSDVPVDPEEDTDPHYVGSPSFNTAGLDAALERDLDPSNDVARVDLMGEITWTIDGGAPSSTRTFGVRVHNDVYRGDEGTPSSLPTPDDYISDRAVRYDIAQTLDSGQQAQAQANLGLPKNNFSAINPPSINDDSTQGYAVGSLWIASGFEEAYRCLDATPTDAVWEQTTLDAAELSAILANYATTGDLAAVEADLASLDAELDNKADDDLSNVDPATVRGSLGFAPQPLVAQTTSIDPTALTPADFRKVTKYRPMSPLDESSIFFEDRFVAAGDGGKWVGGNEANPEFVQGGWQTSANSLVVTPAHAHPRIPFASAAMRIEAMGTTGTAQFALGFLRGTQITGSNGIFGIYRRSDEKLFVYLRPAAGPDYTELGMVNFAWPGPFEICVMMSPESVSIWTRLDDSEPWVMRTVVDIEGRVDFQTESKLNEARPCFYSFQSSGSATQRISRFRAGYPEGVGAANPSVVTYEDGSPIIINDRAYFLANATFPMATTNIAQGIRSSLACIFEVGLSDYKFRIVSRLGCVRNVGGEDKVFGENSGCIVFDREAGEFVALIPDWGSATLAYEQQHYIYRTKSDLLHGVHRLRGEALTLPGDTSRQWDPSLRKEGGQWLVCYNTATSSVSTFKINVAASPDLVNWTATATPVELMAEGLKWLRFGGAWYVVGAVSNSDDFVFLPPDLTSVETISTPTDGARNGLACHAQFIHVPRGQNSQLMLITMDNFRFNARVYSWGCIELYEVGAETAGWEWAIPSVLPSF